MRKATAAQDCKGHTQARELLEECEASGQMTPEQAYAHWLAGEIGNRSEGGTRLAGDDSIRLPSNRCPVCAGRCPVPQECHLPIESKPRSFSPSKFACAIGFALLGGLLFLLAF